MGLTCSKLATRTWFTWYTVTKEWSRTSGAGARPRAIGCSGKSRGRTETEFFLLKVSIVEFLSHAESFFSFALPFHIVFERLMNKNLWDLLLGWYLLAALFGLKTYSFCATVCSFRHKSLTPRWGAQLVQLPSSPRWCRSTKRQQNTRRGKSRQRWKLRALL